jgi:hypothetical protein
MSAAAPTAAASSTPGRGPCSRAPSAPHPDRLGRAGHRPRCLRREASPRPPAPTSSSTPLRCFGTRGEKGPRHGDSEDELRRRANKRRGHVTFATDLPPVPGVVECQTGRAQLFVFEDISGVSLQEFVGRVTAPGVMVYGDESGGCSSGTLQGHATVCDAPGRRERTLQVHNNTLEGLWEGAAELTAAVPGRQQMVL